MNTGEVATRLGTTQKELRRFLRSDPSYTNASNTTAGRYNFEESDISTLTKRFAVWQSKNVNRKRPVRVSDDMRGKFDRPRADPDGDPGMPVDILNRRLTRTERARRDQMSRERLDRLEERLRANGNHISQLRDRESVSG